MMQSENDRVGGQQFHIKVRQLPNGEHEASCEGMKCVAKTPHGATLKMNDLLDKHVRDGYKKAKS
jgi:hypothetical protein